MEVKKKLLVQPSAEAEVAGNTTVPSDMGEHRKAFALMGLSFGELVEGDPTRIHCELPNGWTKEPIGPFVYLMDQNGRKRGMIFRKYAGTTIHQMLAMKRLSLLVGHNNNGLAYAHVRDGDTVIHSVGVPIPGPHHNALQAKESAERQALQWLQDTFPEWEDPTAYWDQEDLMK